MNRCAWAKSRTQPRVVRNTREGDTPIKYIVAISRILLGLIFVVFGLNGFLHFIPGAQLSGVARQFIGAIFASHFYIIVFLTQIVGGLLLLANRYVPLGLLLLGPVIVNILGFHIFMSPSNISLALVATALWFIVFFRVRGAFSGVFVQSFEGGKAQISRQNRAA
jgi:putative oxidoreductase